MLAYRHGQRASKDIVKRMWPPFHSDNLLKTLWLSKTTTKKGEKGEKNV